MRAYVHQDGGDAELEDIGEKVDLPYDLDTAIELWLAWRDHGVMPCAGGYFDQPRAWRRVIQFFSSRYAPIHQQYMAREYPDKPQDDDKRYEGDAPKVNGWEGLGNWTMD